MGKFHDELVDRRRSAAGADLSPAPEAPPVSDSAVKFALTLIEPQPLFACEGCGSAVPSSHVATHVQRHRDGY